MADYFKRVQEKTATKFWINNVTQEQARLAIEAGARNCTQNPTYSWKILNSKTDGEEARGTETENGGMHRYSTLEDLKKIQRESAHRQPERQHFRGGYSR